MRKSLLVSLILCLFLTKTTAQTKSAISIVPSWNNSASMFQDTFIGKTNSKGKLGLGIGVDYSKMLGESFYLSGMLSMQMRGYKGSANVRALYYDIPLTINLAFGKHKYWTVGTGVYGGMCLAGSYKSPFGWTRIKLGESLNDSRSRLDHGLVFQFGASQFSYFGRIYMLAYVGTDNIIPNDRQIKGQALKLRTMAFHWAIPISTK